MSWEKNLELDKECMINLILDNYENGEYIMDTLIKLVKTSCIK